MDGLIAQLQEHCRQKILRLHSRMRLLSGEEIGVDQLYVDVWVLKRSPRTLQVSQDKLLQSFDVRNDRLGLGKHSKRDPGFKVANAYAKLLILGKPGTGKTTFLKHLAVDWCKKQFQPDLITVFIELRRIRDKQWHLLDAIGKELGLDEGYQIRALKQKIQDLQRSVPESTQEKENKGNQIKEFQQQLEALSLQILLKKGKLLVLMDGFDEVPTKALRHGVQNQLRQVEEDYEGNRWILTCRTQIIESIPDGFTPVEVAEFRLEQVQQFFWNWFQASGYSAAESEQQWKKFDGTISQNSALRELTVTPVLLSLMCLVFHDEGEMPSQMVDLYQRGIRLLLEKWNDDKAIEGWEIGSDTYRALSVEQKEDLLIEIAAHKFENPENFVLFKQNEIADQITQFLHLSNRKDGIAVLKSMEAQHGLLIERADELWSFSHLTFQEHFTVQWLTRLSPKQLAGKIANPRWQQIVEQLVKSQQPADRLVRLIKQSIDRSISGKPEFNQFLTWVFQKADSVQARYKPAALRAIYFTLELAHDRDIEGNAALDIELALELARDRELARALEFAHDRDFARALDFARDHDLAHDRALVRALGFAHDLARARTHVLARDFARELALIRELALTRNSEFALRLEQLRRELPLPGDRQHLQYWWQVQGQKWLKQLRQVMIEHRNIGHNWQFSEAQQQQLRRYYDANYFLVNLMQIEGAVSQGIQAEIEDNLLLPWEELQRRYPGTYGQVVTNRPPQESSRMNSVRRCNE